jgi:PXA domain
VYHALNPHPALSPIPDPNDPDACAEQSTNETLHRQLLVQGVLAVLLPTEDLDNTCLRTLVGDIIADLILCQGISAKACEGWFVHDAIAKVAEVIRARIEPKATSEEMEVEARSRLERFGLLSSKDEQEQLHSSTNHQSPLSGLFWRILQYAYLLSLFIRFVLSGLSQARYLPPRTWSGLSPDHVTKTVVASKSPSLASASELSTLRPIVEYRFFTLISTLLDLSTRMPWLAGALSMWQHFTTSGPGRFGRTNSLFDK